MRVSTYADNVLKTSTLSCIKKLKLNISYVDVSAVTH